MEQPAASRPRGILRPGFVGITADGKNSGLQSPLAELEIALSLFVLMDRRYQSATRCNRINYLYDARRDEVVSRRFIAPAHFFTGVWRDHRVRRRGCNN